jgi:hypothetical protein
VKLTREGLKLSPSKSRTLQQQLSILHQSSAALGYDLRPFPRSSLHLIHTKSVAHAPASLLHCRQQSTRQYLLHLLLLRLTQLYASSSHLRALSDIPDNPPDHSRCDNHFHKYPNYYYICNYYYRCSKLRPNPRLHLAEQLMGGHTSFIRAHQRSGLRVLLHRHRRMLELATRGHG